MVGVSESHEDVELLILGNSVHHATTIQMNVMRAQYDPTLADVLHHVNELAHFAQLNELGSDAVGRKVVAAQVNT